MGPGPDFDEAAALRGLQDRQQIPDVVLRPGRGAPVAVFGELQPRRAPSRPGTPTAPQEMTP